MMYDSVKSFRCKLSLWAKQLESNNLAHFPALQSLPQVEPEQVKDYSAIVSQLLEEFDRRLCEFRDGGIIRECEYKINVKKLSFCNNV